MLNMWKINIIAKYLLIVSAAIFMLGGCASPSIDISVASQPNVNPDHTGRPSPVILRIYELRSDLAFQQADFYSLFERYMQVLSADLLSAKELACAPGKPYTISYEPLPETRYIGIISGFRQIERSQWRVIVPVEAKKKNPVLIEVNDTTVFLVPEEHRKGWTPEEAIEFFKQQFESKNIK